MAKLYASEIGGRVADRAVQIFGGYGFVKDFPVEKFYRDVEAVHDRRGAPPRSSASSSRGSSLK